MEFKEKLMEFYKEMGASCTMVVSTSYQDVVMARTMEIIIDEGKLYFITDKKAREYQQLMNNKNVSLCYNHISVEGVCKEQGHPEKFFWIEQLYKDYYPETHKRYFSLETAVLFQVEPLHIQMWINGNEQPYVSELDIEGRIYRKEQCDGEVEDYKPALMKKLLTIGGTKVLMPETVSEELYNFGHLYDYKVLVPVGGTSRYFLNHEEEVRVLWGFVLDEEGVWEMHSWLIDPLRQIIIDNQNYEKYFGFIK